MTPNGGWWSTGHKEVSGALPPYLCLISTDAKNGDLYLTFSLQVRWAYGIDYMHNGSIRSYDVIFPEIKEHGYEKSGIPVHEAL